MDKTDLQIRVPNEVALEWRRAARAQGVTVGAWIRLKIEGKLDAPVPKQEALEVSWLRERIMDHIGDGPFHRANGPRLAMKLGVQLRSINSSLGSMVASKRLVREGDTYRRADK